jgi:hypothetical protein
MMLAFLLDDASCNERGSDCTASSMMLAGLLDDASCNE